MRAGNDFTQCRTGRGLAALRRPFGDARLPVRHCAAGAEVPPRHQTTQPKNEVLTSNRDLTSYYNARKELTDATATVRGGKGLDPHGETEETK